MLLEPADDVPHDVGGDAKAHVVAPHDLDGVDPDDPALRIDQRPAAVARVDGRVRLQPRVVLVHRSEADVAARVGEDPERNASGETERRAKSHDELAFFDAVGIREFRVRRRTDVRRQVQLEQRQVRLSVLADQLGADLLLVPQDAVDLDGLIHDVVIGHRGSVGRDDHPAAEDLLALLFAGLVGLGDRLDEDQSRIDSALGRFDDLFEVQWRPGGGE